MDMIHDESKVILYVCTGSWCKQTLKC
jgi:hypothetical protein